MAEEGCYDLSRRDLDAMHALDHVTAGLGGAL